MKWKTEAYVTAPEVSPFHELALSAHLMENANDAWLNQGGPFGHCRTGKAVAFHAEFAGERNGTICLGISDQQPSSKQTYKRYGSIIRRPLPRHEHEVNSLKNAWRASSRPGGLQALRHALATTLTCNQPEA